jgi:hypothetical protein
MYTSSESEELLGFRDRPSLNEEANARALPNTTKGGTIKIQN